VVPPDLPELYDILSRHFRDEPGVEIVIERRRGERRSDEDRRHGSGKPPLGADRRRLHHPAGRRVGERRAIVRPAERPPSLPEEVAEYADRLSFVALWERADAPTPTQRQYFARSD
jgi:hypothetical protein